MSRIKLTLLTTLALIVSSVWLAAAANCATNVQTVRVTEVSYGIRFSAKPRAGAVRFVVKNASGDDHDLRLRGGGKTWKTRVMRSLGSSTLTATLKKGVRYTFWCGVDDHRQEGMSGSFVTR